MFITPNMMCVIECAPMRIAAVTPFFLLIFNVTLSELV